MTEHALSGVQRAMINKVLGERVTEHVGVNNNTGTPRRCPQRRSERVVTQRTPSTTPMSTPRPITIASFIENICAPSITSVRRQRNPMLAS